MKLRRISTTENQRPDRSEKRLSGIFQKNYQKKLSKKLSKNPFFENCFPNQKKSGFGRIFSGLEGALVHDKYVCHFCLIQESL